VAATQPPGPAPGGFFYPFTSRRLCHWPSWRNGEILGGSAFSASSQDRSLSSGFAHNELMQLCLLRWQDERIQPRLGGLWRFMHDILINRSFGESLPSRCVVKGECPSAQNFSISPGKPKVLPFDALYIPMTL
jgi:hypothetical protein